MRYQCDPPPKFFDLWLVYQIKMAMNLRLMINLIPIIKWATEVVKEDIPGGNGIFLALVIFLSVLQ